MTSDLDIYRTASVLIREHRDRRNFVSRWIDRDENGIWLAVGR